MFKKKNSAVSSPRKRAFTVAPGPLNPVKFELGVILVIGMLLLLIQGRITDAIVVQFLLLLGYGILGMGWIIFRTRQVMVKMAAKQRCNRDGPN